MTLGHGIVSTCKIVWVLLWFPVRRRLGFQDKEVIFSINKNGRMAVVHLNGAHDEFLILEEILSSEEYAVPVVHPQVIFDVGGNIGLSALYYALSYPHAKVYSFEPSPATYQRLVQNVTQCQNIIPYRIAMTKNDGPITFYDYPQKSISSSLTKRGAGGVETTVAGLSLASAIKKCAVDRIDILKFDIEGAEYNLFQDFDSFEKVGYITGEVHEDLMGVPAETLFTLLRKYFELQITPGGKAGRYIVKGYNKSLHQVYEKG